MAKPKAFRAPQLVEGARLTVRLPNRMRLDVKDAMKKTGYGVKEQSRWISEAIDRLCEIPYFPELVAEDYIGGGQNTPIRVTIPASTQRSLTKAIKKAEQEENLEDVKSKLIRTAIIQRLIVREQQSVANR